MNELISKLFELKTGLQQKDPKFCGVAPEWLIEKVLRNLDNVIAQARSDGQEANQRIKDFAIGAIRYVADQMTDGSDILLDQLNELATLAGPP